MGLLLKPVFSNPAAVARLLDTQILKTYTRIAGLHWSGDLCGPVV